MSIFLIYSLALYWGFQHSNVTKKFVQLHYFYHKMLGGQKISCAPLSKCWGNMSLPPPLNSVLAYKPLHQVLMSVSVTFLMQSILRKLFNCEKPSGTI